MIRIIIADDHALIRTGIRQILSYAGDIDVVAEAASGAELLARLRDVSCDLILLDMTMPGISGTDLIARIRSHWADTAILVLSMHNESQVAARALRAGSDGYITKDSEPEVLIAAVHKVAAGGRYIDPSIAEQIAFALTAAEEPAHTSLSDREYEVFILLASGLSVNEIAERLVISNKTVSTHKVRLMQKLKAASVADLVRYAVDHNLIA